MIQAETLESLPGVRHGFFTRRGGVSSGIYASLNCGPGSDDDPDHVATNRGRVMEHLGLRPEALVTVHQVHSPDAVVAAGPWTEGGAPEADALVTNQPGIALGILTADCAPVLFADADAGVIGAAHAGWRGALGGVLGSCVEAMVRLGAGRERIAAGIGPCIGSESYETGPEFHAEVVAADSDNARYFGSAKRPGHYMFDLPGYITSRLEALEIGGISKVPHDTLTEEALFFSYRRTTLRGEADYGRQLSAITLGP